MTTELQLPLKFSAVGCEIKDMSLEEWAACGHKILRASSSLQWVLGDWAEYGDKLGKLKEWADANSVNVHTLRKYALVSSKVQRSNRHEKLSWSHHAEVSELPAAKQLEWLELAERESLSVAAMREKIRTSTPGKNALLSDGPVLRTVGNKVDDVRHFLLGQPDEFWTKERKDGWRERLRPLVEFYERLG